MIPAIHYITTIHTYILVHPLTRAPETRLTRYLVAANIYHTIIPDNQHPTTSDTIVTYELGAHNNQI